SHALFVLVNVLPPLLAGGVLSMGRLTATVFPLFLALAAVTPPRAVTPLISARARGQGLVAALFFRWSRVFGSGPKVATGAGFSASYTARSLLKLAQLRGYNRAKIDAGTLLQLGTAGSRRSAA